MEAHVLAHITNRYLEGKPLGTDVEYLLAEVTRLQGEVKRMTGELRR